MKRLVGVKIDDGQAELVYCLPDDILVTKNRLDGCPAH
jgi:hypothetical protein